MKKYDYLIVGQGLAGTILAHRLVKEGKQVFVVDSVAKKGSSLVAPGMYNPMVLKRFTKCWNVEKQLPYLYKFLDTFEEEFHCNIHERLPLYRILNSIKEQNLWYESSDKASLAAYMSDEILSYESSTVNSNFGLGEVRDSGRVHIAKMIALFREYLIAKGMFLNEGFNYSEIDFVANTIHYKEYCFDKLIFCEGFSMIQNPYFSYLPLLGTKGELIEIKAPALKLDKLIKGGVFILPLGNDLYKVGATFNWKDKTTDSTEEAKVDLQKKLEQIINVPYELVNQTAGIRPTVKDRRPLMGQHPIHKQLYVFNGLGTRGLLIAPYLAKQMFDYLECKQLLDSECDISRYQEMHLSTFE